MIIAFVFLAGLLLWAGVLLLAFILEAIIDFILKILE